MNSQQGDYSALKHDYSSEPILPTFFQNHFIHYWILMKHAITFMLVTNVDIENSPISWFRQQDLKTVTIMKSTTYGFHQI